MEYAFEVSALSCMVRVEEECVNGETKETIRTLADIAVKPPIVPGDGFKDAVLGRERAGVDVMHACNLPDMSLFVAESTRRETGRKDTDVVVGRIAELINLPGRAGYMMLSTPFGDD